ncbi:hypothetical protein ONE63_005137 [Megalurothrips usitatus]|uniref:ATP-dependent DNA helicase n=1 Tax=Megalurothrips usitatus TaxID=439358 RepID=A0AAV7Y1B1_9NEOP|nr:hypothetical protein ONE63_005137 [Megalurothrips usitatus]
MVDRSLRDLMGNNVPFGGKIFLCAGDFRHIAPVVEKAQTPQEIVSASLCSSDLWQHFVPFRLTAPQRTRGADAYSAFLLQVGNGTAPEVRFGEGREAEFLVALPGVRHSPDVDHLIAEIYPPEIVSDPDAAAKRAILASLNINVKVNQQGCPGRCWRATP